MNIIVIVALACALALSLAVNGAQEKRILHLRAKLYDAYESLSPVGCAAPGLWEDEE